MSNAGKEVRCKTCDWQYKCTPSSDYFDSNGITDEDGIVVDGVCESCLPTKARMTSVSHSRIDDYQAIIIGEGVI